MAAAQKAEGVILRKYYLRETSYILVVFTRQFGKIRGVIKGVRKPYPQFAGNFEIATRCHVLFYKKKKTPLDLITQCDTLDPFLGARKDIERLTYANYFIELIDTVCNDYDVNEGLYDVLNNALAMLGKVSSAKRVGRIFEIKLLGCMGLSPVMGKCAACGGDVGSDPCFSPPAGGILCPGCVTPDQQCVKVSRGTVRFIQKIQDTDMNRTPGIKVSRRVGIETEKVLGAFLRYHIGKPLRSVKFLEQIKGIAG